MMIGTLIYSYTCYFRDIQLISLFLQSIKKSAVLAPPNPFTLLVIGFCYNCSHDVDIIKGLCNIICVYSTRDLEQGIICHV